MNRRCYRLEVEQLEDRLAPATVTWDGGGDGSNWGDGDNWDTGALPGSGDDVAIGFFSPGVTISGLAVDVNSLSCSAPLTVDSTSTLTLAANSNVDDYFFCVAGSTVTVQVGASLDLRYAGSLWGSVLLGAGASLNLIQGSYGMQDTNVTGAGTLTMAAYAQLYLEAGSTSAMDKFSMTGGTLAGPGDLQINGVMNWTGGVMTNTGGVTIASAATLTIAGTVGMLGPNIANYGQTIWAAGNITAVAGSFHNEPGANFDITNSTGQIDMQQWDMYFTLTNDGTLTKSGAGIANLVVDFSNNNMADVQAGTLMLSAGGQSSGSVNVAAAGTLSCGADYGIGGAFSLDGTLTGGAKLTVAGTMLWSAGTQEGQGITEVVGQMLISTAGSKYLTDRTIDNFGSTQWIAGAVVFDKGTLHNHNNAVFDIQADDTMQDVGNTPAVFQNDGLLKKTATAGGQTVFQVAINNIGNIDVQVGVLGFQGGGQVGGNAQAAAGGRLEMIDGNFSLLPGLYFSGAGFLVSGMNALQNPQLIAFGQVAVSNLEMNSGVISGPGTFIVANRLNLNGGRFEGSGITRIDLGATMQVAGNGIVVQIQRTVENYGIINHDQGVARAWSFGQGATLKNFGDFNYRPSGVLSFIRAPITDLSGIVQNTGRFTILGAGTTSLANLEFQNTGTFRVQGGTVNFVAGGSFANSGTFNVLAGTLSFASAATWTNTGIGSFWTGATGTVIFRDGVYAFDNSNQVDPCLLGGLGWFILDDNAGRLLVQAGSVVAHNFQIRRGTLDGPGQFEANLLIWSGGSMEGTGVTDIGSGQLDITGTLVVLQERTVLVQGGSLNWQPGAASIDVSQNAQIRIESSAVKSGAFNIYEPYGSINAIGPNAGQITLGSGAVLNRNAFPAPGNVTIALPVQNNGGAINYVGNGEFAAVQNDGGAVSFAGQVRFSTFSQSQAGASSVFDLGTYTFSAGLAISGGTATLNDGDFRLLANQFPTPTIRNATFNCKGAIGQGNLYTDNATVNVTGAFSVAGHTYLQNNSEVHLQGNTFNAQAIVSIEASRLLMENGVINANGGQGVVTTNGGVLRGPGTVNRPGGVAVQVSLGGRLEAGPGLLTINGDLELLAGAVVESDIGGTLAADFGQINVLGQATLAGTVEATLIGGFLPDPGVPDVFSILQFSSYVGAFDNSQIDLGGGLFFDIAVNPSDVTLTTVSP